MAESMAVFAPNANSYRRFVSESYAPIAPIWGINNRTVSLRVPAGPPASRHVEHRIAGADANLYLAVAAVLAGAAQGCAIGVDPGPPVEGNGYAQVQRAHVARAPGARRSMLAAQSEFLARCAGRGVPEDLSRDQGAGVRAVLGRGQRARLRLVPAQLAAGQLFLTGRRGAGAGAAAGSLSLATRKFTSSMISSTLLR